MKHESEIHRRRDALKLLLAASALASGSLPVIAADAWPSRPVKIVVAVGPGSAGDTLARIIAPQLELLWKQPVIVENKPGAGGIVGTEYAAGATDGHTLLLGSQSSLLPQLTRKNLRLNPLTELQPICRVIEYQLFMATNAQTAKRAKTLGEFIALSKSTEGGVFAAGTGPTSIFNITLAILNRSLGMRYSSVNFNNVGEMDMALLRDDAQLVLNTPSALKGQVESGAVVPLAVVSKQRYANLPNVPTVIEAGYTGYLPLLWAGFFAPKSMPVDVIDRINHDVAQVLFDPTTRKKIETTVTGTVVKSSPAEFSAQIKEEVAVWADLLRAMNYKPE